MQGNVGILNHFEVAGFSWIGNDRHDHVMIMVNGEEVATVPANRFRSDLRMAGVGDGRSAFKFAFADVPGIFKSVEIEALSKESGRHLPNGKRTLQPLLDGGAPFRHSLARRCVAFVPTRMVRQGNRIVVIARAILPTDFEMTVVSVGSCEGSQGKFSGSRLEDRARDQFGPAGGRPNLP